MANVRDHLTPAGAAAWLRQLHTHLHGDDTLLAQRRGLFEAGAAEIDVIPLGYWYSTQRENSVKAWNVAGRVVREAGVPQWEEVTEAKVDELQGVYERHQAGESGGLPAYTRFFAETWEDAVLLGEDVLGAAAVGTGEGTKKGLWLLKNIWWVAPVVLTGGAVAYFWPVISTALKARQMAKTRLHAGVDQTFAGIDHATAQIKQEVAGYLPAPQGAANWRPTGQAAQGFPPGVSYDETSDPFAPTETFPPVGFSEIGSSVGFSNMGSAVGFPNQGASLQGFSAMEGGSVGGSLGFSEVGASVSDPFLPAPAPLPTKGQANGSFAGFTDTFGSIVDADWTPIED